MWLNIKEVTLILLSKESPGPAILNGYQNMQRHSQNANILGTWTWFRSVSGVLNPPFSQITEEHDYLNRTTSPLNKNLVQVSLE